MKSIEKDIEAKVNLIKRQSEKIIFDRQENSQLYHSTEWAEVLYRYIITGNKDELERIFTISDSNSQSGNLAKTELRNNKNLTICLISTMNYRLRYDRLLNPEYSNAICDSCILLIEEQTDSEMVTQATLAGVLAFADAVQKNKQGDYHPLVKSVRDYVHKNFHKKIVIQEMAEDIGVNNSYLSQVFHKYTGISIKQYITDEKLERSKNLLTFSDYSIQEIAAYLDFSGSSHFGSEFRKKVGMTPREYRAIYSNNYRKQSD